MRLGKLWEGYVNGYSMGGLLERLRKVDAQKAFLQPVAGEEAASRCGRDPDAAVLV